MYSNKINQINQYRLDVHNRSAGSEWVFKFQGLPLSPTVNKWNQIKLLNEPKHFHLVPFIHC